MRGLAVVGALLVSLVADRAEACECFRSALPTYIDESIREATTIFVGELAPLPPQGPPELRASGADREPSLASNRVALQPSRILKGPQTREPVRVWTAATREGCGVDFRPGTSYVVFAYTDASGELETSTCTLTAPVRTYIVGGVVALLLGGVLLLAAWRLRVHLRQRRTSRAA